uniref:Uncharacterized protein n=1 Tax=Strigamia maritima TaxID=126957 RepID=T1JP93_STRMM
FRHDDLELRNCYKNDDCNIK